jgi:hypothetical protein
LASARTSAARSRYRAALSASASICLNSRPSPARLDCCRDQARRPVPRSREQCPGGIFAVRRPSRLPRCCVFSWPTPDIFWPSSCGRPSRVPLAPIGHTLTMPNGPQGQKPRRCLGQPTAHRDLESDKGQTLPSRLDARNVRFSQERPLRVGKTDIGSPTTGMRTISAVPDDRRTSPFIAIFGHTSFDITVRKESALPGELQTSKLCHCRARRPARCAGSMR